jgi:class 3 adenylate cyclase/tetratricopeptide (TPR) repeat protein
MQFQPEPISDKPSSLKQNLEGEHKVISALFTDVVNYTSLAAKLDLDSVREIMNDHFQILMECVNKYEGTVNQLLGDGMVAFFGAPFACEDHAQRACYAALAMQEGMQRYAETVREKFGIDFRIRMGINSGPVLVGSIGNDRHTEYIATGDTVNLASRLENASEPGEILVSENIYAATRDFFRFQPMGDIEVKGKEKPVAAFRLVQALKTERRFDAAVSKGLTQFVGRDEELEILRQTFSQAQDGKGRIVGIMGEPGIGKSRLLREFRESFGSEDIRYLEGRCLQYGSSMPFKPLVDIVKAYFEIYEGEPESQAKYRIMEKLRKLDEALVDYLPFLYDLLSFKIEDERYLGMENQYKRSKLFEGAAQLLVKESSSKPLVLAVEDLHWMDKASEEFFTYLMSRLPGSRILLLLLYRPEYLPPWAGQPNYEEIHLNQLSTSTSQELLQCLLPDGEPGPELAKLVLTKTGGNPLFLEEFVHNLIDNGSVRKEGSKYTLSSLTSTIKLPDTIQGIIASRIDKLPEGLKNTLRVASVIGRDFSYPVLRDVTQLPEELKNQLDTLQQLEFIIRKSDSPETECVFKHALIQEVAYDGLLQKRRKELHQSIGQTIEKLYFSRLDEFVEVLAYHYQQSSSPDKALEYLHKSASKALKRNAIEESHRYYQQAFEIISNKANKDREDQQFLLDVVLEWAEVFYYRSDSKPLIDLLKRHERLAASLGDKYRHAMLLGWLGNFLAGRGQMKESYQCLRQAVFLAEESGNPKAIAYVNGWMVWTCGLAGLTDEGLSCGEKAMEAFRNTKGADYPYFKALSGIGLLLSYMGKNQKALECGTKLIEFGETQGNLHSLAMGYYMLSLCYANAGEIPKSLDYCRQGLRLDIDPVYYEVLEFTFGYICVLAGRLLEAEATLKRVVIQSQRLGNELFGWPASAYLGMILISKGQMKKGFRMLSEANKNFINHDSKVFYMINQYLYGMLYAQLAAPTAPIKVSLMMQNLGFILRHAPFAARKAIAHYEIAANIAKECGFNSFLGMTFLELGRLYKQKGNTGLARQNLSAAVKLCRECEAIGNLKQAESLLESLINKK